jgi:glycogen phosphorylase
MPIIRRDLPNHFSLPRRINRLSPLTYNLWWAWNPDAQRLFSFINKDLWEQVYHNPVAFLRKIDRARLNAVTNDRYYLDFYDRVINNFENYLKTENTWFARTYPKLSDRLIGYFSFEFGLHESLPVYAGGMGTLSGDHMKEASDLGLPVVAVGFLYTQGYFRSISPKMAGKRPTTGCSISMIWRSSPCSARTAAR